MKIVAINSSHRGDRGYTRFLLDKLCAGATAAGATREIVTLAKLKINRCLSCGTCHTPEHYLRCVYDDKDDVRGIFDNMAAADIIVFATPIYIFNMSGLLKTFLDRSYGVSDVFKMTIAKSGLTFHHVDAAICSKPFAVLMCCDNMERETPQNVINYFQTYSRFMDAPQVGLLVRNSGGLAGHGADPEAENRLPVLQKIYQAYMDAGRELATVGRISAHTQRIANQPLIRMPWFVNILKRFKPMQPKILAESEKIRRASAHDA